jgi:YVTN family beta-propeller protein
MASPQSSTRVFVTGPTRRRVAHGLLTALLLCAGPGFLTPSGLAPTAVGAEPVAAAALPSGAPLAPESLAISPDGARLYVAAAAANRVLVIDTASGAVSRSIPTPAPPSGLAVSRDGSLLVVTCAAAASPILLIETRDWKVTGQLTAGHTAMAPVLGADEEVLYVCNRFDHNVAVFGLSARREVARIPVRREPVAAALTPDGERLVVANHLHAGRADVETVAAEVTVINTSDHRVLKHIALGNGSGLLRGVSISPDGRFAAVTHILARYHLPTTQVDRGWMNSNALSLIDLAKLEWHNTVLLDSVDRGAANPWSVLWSRDGKQLLVTHAGTHELSVIDAPALLEKLARLPSPTLSPTGNAPDDLTFLVGLRRRIALGGKGPRALAANAQRVYVAQYFSDSLSVLELSDTARPVQTLELAPGHTDSLARQGESHFNDGTLCFQGWQSCASCHSSDARVDGLNWDLLNDGIGNPKNSKSLLLSHRTPPAMSQGVRESAELAVRAGIRHILFTVQPDAVAQGLDEYLKSLAPLPSPHLEGGKLSAAARRGRQVFLDAKTRCAECHPPALYTALHSYNVGTRAAFDTVDEFDTPTLVELWRTAPYLHDGSALTVREVLTTHNAHDQHGATSHLTPAQMEDLVVFLLSL